MLHVYDIKYVLAFIGQSFKTISICIATIQMPHPERYVVVFKSIVPGEKSARSKRSIDSLIPFTNVLHENVAHFHRGINNNCVLFTVYSSLRLLFLLLHRWINITSAPKSIHNEFNFFALTIYEMEVYTVRRGGNSVYINSLFAPRKYDELLLLVWHQQGKR